MQNNLTREEQGKKNNLENNDRLIIIILCACVCQPMASYCRENVAGVISLTFHFISYVMLTQSGRSSNVNSIFILLLFVLRLMQDDTRSLKYCHLYVNIGHDTFDCEINN